MKALKNSILLILLAILCGCMGEQKEVSSTTNTAVNRSAPTRWGSTSSFPINLVISSDFSNAEETAVINMGAEWEDALSDELNFFTTSSNTSEKTNGVLDLDDLWDSEQGVYRTATWHDDLPDTALAVTQIFGTRRNSGDPDEFIEILHADILVNYRDFTFSTSGLGGGYDLQTVILHEMGHFLGLGHQSDAAIDSVMYPSISSADVNRVPFEYDIETLSERYDVGGVEAEGAIRRGLASVYEAPTKEQVIQNGTAVKLTLELHSDGTCRHKLNGVQIKSHPHNILKK